MSNVHHFVGQEIQFGDGPALGFASNSASTGQNSYKVTVKKGIHVGVGASVSGLGASAHVQGSFSFSMRTIDTSTAFNELRTKYKFDKGTSGLWGWIAGEKHTDETKEEIKSAFSSLTKETAVRGTANIDLWAEGRMPNFQIDVSAYILIMNVTDAQGNTYEYFSAQNPQGDTGAANPNASSSEEQPIVDKNESSMEYTTI